jgi:hypothetical protein
MSKITTRQVTQLKDIFDNTSIRCAALIKNVTKPMRTGADTDDAKTHAYTQEYYVVAEVEALNIGSAKQNISTVEVIIDTDSSLECNGIYTSLQKAKADAVYVIFDAAFLAIADNHALLQGTRAEITNVKRNAYLSFMSLGTLAK